jgi:hypothetical protein
MGHSCLVQEATEQTGPVLHEMVTGARMWPTKVDPRSIVANLPTAQNTWHVWAPLINRTLEPPAPGGAVVNVVPMRKIKTPLGLPSTSSVSGR